MIYLSISLEAWLESLRRNLEKDSNALNDNNSEVTEKQQSGGEDTPQATSWAECGFSWHNLQERRE